MKRNKLFTLASAALISAGMGLSSCSDWLDLSPIDYYGAGNFWQTEDQAMGNLTAIMNAFRSSSFQTLILYGEMRGGAYTTFDGGSDGSSLYQGTLRTQNLSQTNYGIGNFGGYWQQIGALNLFIANVENANYFSDEDTKNYCLGMALGMRAYYYFVMYRAYGGVPLRLTPEVENGNYDQSALYLARATASETMTQIKSDVNRSLEYFGNQTSFNFNGSSSNAKYYWSKAASEMLAGEIYLWNAKVATGDQPATPADLTTAKEHFTNVLQDYNLELQDNFADVFSPANKQNSEIIFAMPYDENEATNGNLQYYMYSTNSGSTIGAGYDSDGNLWGNPIMVAQTQHRYQYANALWYQFDAEDTRRDTTFVTSWHDQAATQLRGTFVTKNLGSVLSTTGFHCYNGDQPVYRLPLAYLSLAEIANMEGDNASVEYYVNLVRERAYGDNWDRAVYGYTAGTFVQNEVAILHEKDKEFVQEGQRWYDVRRMTVDPACGETDHLLFHEEGHIAYGLTITENMKELSDAPWGTGEGQKIPPEIVVEPILSPTLAYRALWPLSSSDLSNDPELTQTPGYEMSEEGE